MRESLIEVKRQQDNFKTLYVIAHMNQSEVYKAQVNLSVKASAAIEFLLS